MARMVLGAIDELDARLCSWHGGNMRNAIPFKAETVLTLPQENIAAFKALDVNAEAVLTLTDAIVTHANGDNVFVEDATGGICFYKSGAGLVKGNKLTGTIYGKYIEYKSLPELAVVSGKTTLDNAGSD